MQVSSDCDVLQLCKQLQEIRAQLAKARAKAQVDGTVQDKAAAKLDEVCELLKLENQGDSSNIPKDETEDSVPTMTEHEAVDAVADEAACGPAVCAANETVGYFEEPNPLQLIIDAANLDLACETVSTTKDSGSDIVDRKPPVIVGRASDCVTVSSPPQRRPLLRCRLGQQWESPASQGDCVCHSEFGKEARSRRRRESRNEEAENRFIRHVLRK
ncbi:hypothetical protein MTO96_033502 [Rhipicephalus appendiculatus]